METTHTRYAVTEYASSRNGFTRTFDTFVAAEQYITNKARDLALLNGMTEDDAAHTYLEIEEIPAR